VSTSKAEFKYPDKVHLRGYNPTIGGNKHQIKQAAEEIMKAKNPVIYVGGGALFSDAADELLELAEIAQIPVTMTLMGLGSFPGRHPLAMGMLGMHGGYWTNMAMHYSDLLIAIGARFDDRVTGKLSEFCPEARVIHIDIDPTSIKKTFHAHIPIVGDVKAVLRQLNLMLRSMDGNPAEMKALRSPWLKPTLGSIKCSPRNISKGASRALGSPPADSARWDSVFPRRSARKRPFRIDLCFASPAKAVSR
jgi:acetolactate synthase-1/2/3 large subunit